MTTKTEFKNYWVSIKDTKNEEILLETFVQAFRRFKGEFALQELYEKWSAEYQKQPYLDTIEIRETKKMEVSLMRLISRFGSKVSTSELHLHAGKDESWYLCYPPRIESFEKAQEIIRIWFVATYFQVKTRVDPNYLEMFGNFLLKAEGIELKRSISLMDKYVEWICQDFGIQVSVEEMSAEEASDHLLKEDFLVMPLRFFKLSERVLGRLKSADIQAGAELLLWSEKDLMKIRDLGKAGIKEIKDLLAKYDLELE